ncbi:hypothetical protein SAMN05421837_102565 [Amycolatopsis pretoriensis]|uniref:Uncharacterized protein n=1 Tax=Amycolatopsis pretoriensis TaxID=218821 RepID=A0A1H5QFC6_9PSEU|nr:hypothetical protein SAMN05421837_102565 [Amycolatopsis pretoriensis]
MPSGAPLQDSYGSGPGRLSVERGDVDWEARVRAEPYAPGEGEYYSAAWSEAHRAFHRTLLEGHLTLTAGPGGGGRKTAPAVRAVVETVRGRLAGLGASAGRGRPA